MSQERSLVNQEQSRDGRHTKLEFADGGKIDFQVNSIEEIVLNKENYSLCVGHLYLKNGQYYFKHTSEVVVDLKTDHLGVAKKMAMAVSLKLMWIIYEDLNRMVNDDERKQADRLQLSNRLDVE